MLSCLRAGIAYQAYHMLHTWGRRYDFGKFYASKSFYDPSKTRQVGGRAALLLYPPTRVE